ncbi:MAG: protein kinase [Acidobacteriota bacterium]
MALTAGFRLGPYEILSLLGAGGMGEVYRARDPRLGRDVAIKVLPPSFSADADRLRRFEQEAKAAGVLNHPNITTVYDIGTHDGAPYVVQELLEGETLRAELAGGRFSARKAIDYAQQIAQGLAAAHDKGIVHRDLKPENLFVTKDGRVKILDFGLAKLIRSDTAGSSSTTITATQGTEPGVVMGTVAYMSPEQVRGLAVGNRSDIFSFGSTLYEMLSGDRAFTGASAADTMSAILHQDPPDLPTSNHGISPELERILRHCLDKNPQQRFQSARDLAFNLEGLSVESRGAATGGSTKGSTRSQAIYRRLTFRRGEIIAARFSPDSQTIVYTARWEDGARETYATRRDSSEARAFGLPDAVLCGISSAGEMAILLKATRAVRSLPKGLLARVPLAGGAPRELLEDVHWADWLPHSSDLAVVRVVDGQTRLDFPVGNVVYEPTFWIGFPRVSPEGDLLAFIDYARFGDLSGSVAVVDHRGRVQRLAGVWGEVRGLAWSPGGDEVWFTASNAGASRSLRAVDLQGRERLVAQVPGGLHVHDISQSGDVLLSHEVTRMGILGRVAGQDRERELAWFDYASAPHLSADGSVVVFSEEGEGAGSQLSIYLRSTNGSPAIRLGDGSAVALSPDGRWALSLSLSPETLLLVPTGVGQTRKLIHAGLTHHAVGAWSADGKRILFAANEEKRPPRSFVQDLDDSDPRPVTPEGIIGYAISPDGRHVVTGGPSPELYPVEGGPQAPIPGVLPGDTPIRWHEDGQSLFVRSGFLPATVSQIRMPTGSREHFLELIPSHPEDVTYIGGISMTPDGRSYAYSYTWRRSDLYLAEGLT